MDPATGEAERAKHLEKAVRKIVDHCAPERVILFGSEASGAAEEESDIDLLVVSQTSQRPIDRWTDMKRLLRDRGRPFAITPLVYTPEELRRRVEKRDPFIQEVIEKGKVLYG